MLEQLKNLCKTKNVEFVKYEVRKDEYNEYIYVFTNNGIYEANYKKKMQSTCFKNYNFEWFMRKITNKHYNLMVEYTTIIEK